MKVPLRLVLVLLAVLGVGALFLYSERRPGLFANTTYIAAILMIEIVLACLWQFQKVFFPVTMGCFLLAATGLPLAGESFTVRWLFLAVGALVGFSIWMRTNRAQHFGVFHLVALFCVLSALASASASAAATTGLLKALSLFLLFLYASTGGRLAVAGREAAFVRGMVKACEIVVFLVAASYLAGFNIFGNPNNMGAFVGVVATPVLLWAALIAEDHAERRRRYMALALCGILLYVSVCRAAIVADVIIMVGLTIALRRPRLLIRAVFIGALFLEIMAVANPSHMTELMDSFSGRFIFKLDGRPSNQGVFGSRQTPWDDTIAAVKQHPWFGTGFGTSDVGPETGLHGSSIYTLEGTNREHGSSYLAMAEYMGMLGILPFLFLLVLLVRSASQVYRWMRGASSPFHYAVPFALITVAGLIHAAFEDWLFAAGSYLCVFFWVSAFLLIDLSEETSPNARMPINAPIGSFAAASGFSRSPTSV
jgi:O-antigen ligase